MKDFFSKVGIVRIEDNRLGFYFIFSYFPYFIKRVQNKEDKVWYAHKSHMIMWYREGCRRF